jgi:hypothetical protein
MKTAEYHNEKVFSVVSAMLSSVRGVCSTGKPEHLGRPSWGVIDTDPEFSVTMADVSINLPSRHIGQ